MEDGDDLTKPNDLLLRYPSLDVSDNPRWSKEIVRSRNDMGAIRCRRGALRNPVRLRYEGDVAPSGFAAGASRFSL